MQTHLAPSGYIKIPTVNKDSLLLFPCLSNLYLFKFFVYLIQREGDSIKERESAIFREGKFLGLPH